MLKNLPGIYIDGLTEWDFSTHYARVLVENNISPETVMAAMSNVTSDAVSPVGQLMVEKALMSELDRTLSTCYSHGDRVATTWRWISQNWSLFKSTDQSHEKLVEDLTRVLGLLDEDQPEHLPMSSTPAVDPIH